MKRIFTTKKEDMRFGKMMKKCSKIHCTPLILCLLFLINMRAKQQDIE